MLASAPKSVVGPVSLAGGADLPDIRRVAAAHAGIKASDVQSELMG
jgi:hypothetical protein